jgi:tetratricopeptide (TPR) repeat protein
VNFASFVSFVVGTWLFGLGILSHAQGLTPAEQSPLTFTKDVAPIIYARCAGCHRPGGGGPFDLLTYEDVRPRARQIARVTKTREMPPWQPEPDFGEFAGERRLADAEIEIIERWTAQGATRGDPADLPPAPTWPAQWQHGIPDLVLTMPEPYVLPSGGTDVFRTFVISVPVSRGRYVRGVEFRPGNSNAVHHANIKIDRTRSSRRLDEADAIAGFDGGAGRDARFPDGHFLGWTPGQQSHLSPEGLWRLDADSDLVVELHMMPTGKPEPVQVSVGLFLTDIPPRRIPYVLRLGRQDIDIAAGAPDHTITDEYVLPVDVDVLSVQPHAHNLAVEVRAWAEVPNGSMQPLIWIRQWDFMWQDVYRYASPLPLPRGTVLRVQYTYDNSTRNPRNPHRPPQRVTFGQKTSSEMGDLWLQVMTRTDSDRAVLDRDYVPKMLREDTAGVEKMLELAPRDARLHADLAFCYLAAGKAGDAIAHFREAVRLEPASADAHYDLGTALLHQRRLDEARERFDEAVRLRPRFSEAHNNIGVAHFLQGRIDSAIGAYERALSAEPNNAEAHYNLGRAVAAQGNAAAAIPHFRRALEIRIDNADAYVGLGNAEASTGNMEAAIRSYRRGLEINPDLIAALTDLAWLLATADPPFRNPAEALPLAERAARLTDFRNATVLDSLALAYFSTGQLARAVETQRSAVALASGDADDAVQRLRQRLEFYLRELGTTPRQ